MTYLSTNKTINTIRHEKPCPHCAHIVLSIRKEGLRSAYRKHLQAHHKDIWRDTGRMRDYPADSQAPAPSTPHVKPSIICPYCKQEFFATRENLLQPLLVRHKREKHEPQFIDEIAARNESILSAVQAEPLVAVPVTCCHYPRATMRAKYPAPKVVMVPARWNVTGVFVKCCADGKFIAYRARMGASEAWEVG